jgi:hypothetical protein
VKDVVDFRVDERLAIGHDAMNTIIFRKVSNDVTVKSHFPRFDGAVWKAARFIYRDKAVLLRDLRELGAAEAAETCIALRSMPDDLRRGPAGCGCASPCPWPRRCGLWCTSLWRRRRKR